MKASWLVARKADSGIAQQCNVPYFSMHLPLQAPCGYPSWRLPSSCFQKSPGPGPFKVIELIYGCGKRRRL